VNRKEKIKGLEKRRKKNLEKDLHRKRVRKAKRLQKS
jgi:hypothetical protein